MGVSSRPRQLLPGGQRESLDGVPMAPPLPGEVDVKIAIIGAGNIGGALARRLTGLGHEVSIANSRGPETLADLANETGAQPLPVEQVAAGANLVIVTIPMKRIPDLPAGVLDSAADGAVVIDTNNYYPQQRDGRIAEIED